MERALQRPADHARVPRIGEEIANAVTHGLGALAAIAGTIFLILRSAVYGTALDITSASIYGASMILLYLTSCLYHSITNIKAKKVFRIFDHCAIFILILGSYIPISLLIIGGGLGWTLVGINTFCAVLGIILNSIGLSRWHKISLILYIVMGWLAVLAIYPIYLAADLSGILLLLGGGLSYTAGVFFYKNKKSAYAHPVWHLFVLLGCALHYLFIYNYCI